MATTPSPVDVWRGTEGLELPPEVSSEIWSDMVDASVVQQLARQIPVPGGGLTIPIITADPEAQWVDETEEKPVSRPAFGSKPLTPYTLAVIVPFSNQFGRDFAALYAECRRRLPAALGRKFDRTVFGFDDGPGSNFDQLTDAGTMSLGGEDVYDSFLGCVAHVAGSANGADVTGWALSVQAEIAALGAKDTLGRPLFIGNVTTEGSIGSVLARPVYKNANVFDAATDTIGFAGDWASASWGYVESIRVDVSKEATLTDGSKPINLWQRNMFAVKAECEIGFVCRDVDRFVRLTNGGGEPGGTGTGTAT